MRGWWLPYIKKHECKKSFPICGRLVNSESNSSGRCMSDNHITTVFSPVFLFPRLLACWVRGVKITCRFHIYIYYKKRYSSVPKKLDLIRSATPSYRWDDVRFQKYSSSRYCKLFTWPILGHQISSTYMIIHHPIIQLLLRLPISCRSINIANSPSYTIEKIPTTNQLFNPYQNSVSWSNSKLSATFSGP